jgi:hypothetical protein
MNDHTPPPATICKRSLSRVALCDASLPDDLVEWLWTEPQSLISAGQMLQSKCARQTVRLEWNGQSYVLKHCAEPTRRHAIKMLASRSRARRTWNVAHRMADSGILAPRPVACIENRWGPLRRDSYLMYPYIEGRALRSFLETGAPLSRSAVERFWGQLRQLWDQLAEINCGLGDANVGNYVICPSGRMWVIDLDKARIYRTQRAGQRRRDWTWRFLERSWEIAEGRRKRHAQAA